MFIGTILLSNLIIVVVMAAMNASSKAELYNEINKLKAKNKRLQQAVMDKRA